jgi:hypothetical protein
VLLLRIKRALITARYGLSIRVSLVVGSTNMFVGACKARYVDFDSHMLFAPLF